jgi:multiple sugar transport system permease protein
MAAPVLTTIGDRRVRYLLIAPAVFVILLIGLYPLIQLLITSFQNITMFQDDRGFAGFVHYARLFDDGRLWEAIGHTVFVTAVALPLQLGFGFALALLFLEDFPLKRVLLTLVMLPTVIAPIVAGAIWRLLLDHSFGPVNQVIGWFAGREVQLLWTVEPHLVWPAIIMAEVWQWTPFMFLIILAALSNLDRDQLEAAEIDGAGWWTVFRRLVLPAIAPVLAVALLIRGLDLVRLFDVVWTMTQGGPGTMTETLSIYAYNMAFREFEISYSAAIALLVIVLLTVLLVLLLRRIEVQR